MQAKNLHGDWYGSLIRYMLPNSIDGKPFQR